MPATQLTTVRGVELVSQWSAPPFPGEADPAPIVWAHGGNSCRADEDRFAAVDFDRWADLSDRRLLRYDARGHGASGATPEPAAFAWDELARDQLALCDGLDIHRYIAAGRSLGAATAIHAATLAPRRVTKLVLINPPTAWETRDAQADGYLEFADLVRAEGTGFLIEAAAAMPLPDPVADHPDRRRSLVANMERLDPDRLITVFFGTSGANLPSRDAVAAIETPTVIFAWTGDPIHPVDVAEELAEIMPNAALHVSSTWEDVQRWTDIAAEFSG